MAFVYQHIRLDTDTIFYVGIGKHEQKKNICFERAYSKSFRSKHWHNIYKLCGIRVEILCENLTWEDAKYHEKRFIKFYGREDLGEGKLINLTDGGDGASNVICSEETRKKRSKSLSGEKNGFYNKTHSQETLNKISKSRSGIKVTDEHKKLLSDKAKEQWKKFREKNKTGNFLSVKKKFKLNGS